MRRSRSGNSKDSEMWFERRLSLWMRSHSAFIWETEKHLSDSARWTCHVQCGATAVQAPTQSDQAPILVGRDASFSQYFEYFCPTTYDLCDFLFISLIHINSKASGILLWSWKQVKIFQRLNVVFHDLLKTWVLIDFSHGYRLKRTAWSRSLHELNYSVNLGNPHLWKWSFESPFKTIASTVGKKRWKKEWESKRMEKKGKSESKQVKEGMREQTHGKERRKWEQTGGRGNERADAWKRKAKVRANRWKIMTRAKEVESEWERSWKREGRWNK